MKPRIHASAPESSHYLIVQFISKFVLSCAYTREYYCQALASDGRAICQWIILWIRLRIILCINGTSFSLAALAKPDGSF
jgi:hypothetical protein